jgi:hypothetical protein
LSKKCQQVFKVVKKLSKRKVVKKLSKIMKSKILATLAKKLGWQNCHNVYTSEKRCQKVVKKLSKNDCQKTVVKKLSKSWQKVVKFCHTWKKNPIAQ